MNTVKERFWFCFMKAAFKIGRACDHVSAWFCTKGNEAHAWGVYGNGRLWDLGKTPAQLAAKARTARGLRRP